MINRNAQLLLTLGRSQDPFGLTPVRRLVAAGWPLPIVSHGPNQQRQRSRSAWLGLKTDADVFMMLDPGTIAPPEDFQALVDRARETKGICGGLYSHETMMYNFHGEGAHTRPKGEYVPRVYRIGPQAPAIPIEVDAIGTGMLAFHRDVLEGVQACYPELRTCNQEFEHHTFYGAMLPTGGETFHYLDEDHAFCWRAKRLGFKVELMPNIVCADEWTPWWHPIHKVMLAAQAKDPLTDEPECGWWDLRIMQGGIL